MSGRGAQGGGQLWTAAHVSGAWTVGWCAGRRCLPMHDGTARTPRAVRRIASSTTRNRRARSRLDGAILGGLSTRGPERAVRNQLPMVTTRGTSVQARRLGMACCAAVIASSSVTAPRRGVRGGPSRFGFTCSAGFKSGGITAGSTGGSSHTSTSRAGSFRSSAAPLVGELRWWRCGGLRSLVAGLRGPLLAGSIFPSSRFTGLRGPSFTRFRGPLFAGLRGPRFARLRGPSFAGLRGPLLTREIRGPRSPRPIRAGTDRAARRGGARQLFGRLGGIGGHGRGHHHASKRPGRQCAALRRRRLPLGASCYLPSMIVPGTSVRRGRRACRARWSSCRGAWSGRCARRAAAASRGSSWPSCPTRSSPRRPSRGDRARGARARGARIDLSSGQGRGGGSSRSESSSDDGLGARLLDASEQVWAVTGVDLTRVLRDKLGEDGRVGVFTSEAGRKWVHVDEHQSWRRPGKPPASPPLYLHNSAKSKI